MSGFQGELFENLHTPSQAFLRNTEKLVGLKAEPPTRMLQAVLHNQLDVSRQIWAIHWLQAKVSKV
jgi:hypothetical protein